MGFFDRFRNKNKTEAPEEQIIGGENAFNVLKQVIGTEQVHAAHQTLLRYKQGKANLETRIVENEEWFKLRHWECMRKGRKNEVEPTSGFLLNAILNKLADSMDAYPSPNILPREIGDKSEAEKLSSIIPVVLDQCEFEQTYSDVCEYKLKVGTGVYGVFWDSNKNNIGDINITKVDLINLYWESGITDIQQSRNVFYCNLMDNDLLEQAYPQLQGKLGGSTMELAKYIYDDTVDTSNKSLVVDWYYKKRQNGKTVLHYCKYVNDTVLFATENDPQFKEKGWYDHGMYPFVFDTLYKTAGTPVGFGFIDIGKSAQEYIDRGNAAIMQNMLANAKPRYFVRDDGDVNEEEFTDLNKDLVHVGGNLGQDSVIPIQSNTLGGIYVEVINRKIEELKEVVGNRDVTTGGAGGVTAASAVAALQESGSKLSRMGNKAAYRAYRKVIYMVIELIRQFYDLPRQFRILGQNGSFDYVTYSNEGIKPQYQGMEMGIDMGYRMPVFDIEVSAEKMSPYTRLSQNELSLQFYNAGFFSPELVNQSLACLEMMDFPRKNFIMERIAKNGTMYQQIMQLQQQVLALSQIVDAYRGSNLTEQTAAMMSGQPAPGAVDGGDIDAKKLDSLGGGVSEPAITKKARERVANATQPL